MTASPSSAVQEARAAVAARLRDLRLDADLSARALSAAAGWHEAKTSRIEHGHAAPSAADIRAWCVACGAEDQASDLIASSRAADTMYVEWRRLTRTGLGRIQAGRVPLYDRTRLMRVYCSNVIPGLFQTPSYARALLAVIGEFHVAPDDVDAAVSARMDRNRVLEGPGRFVVLVEEAVLRYRIGDAEVMAGQLGHLLAVMSLPSVAMGIVPFATPSRPMWPIETFTMFDTERVHVEQLSAQVTITADPEIELYLRAFERLRSCAVYGLAARSLITSALQHLSLTG
jgi:transcriptional regulator with XRE-family HTH domain